MNNVYNMKKEDEKTLPRSSSVSRQCHFPGPRAYASLRSPPHPGHQCSQRARPWRHSLSLFMTSLLCSTGVIWQLYAITDNFLRYSLVSEVYMEKYDEISPPSFSICFPFVELLDWSQVSSNNVSKEEFYLMSEVGRNRVRQMIRSNLTIRQIFDLTPELRDLMKSSQVRVNELFEISEDPQLINVVRFVKDDLICYRLTSAIAVSNIKSYKLNSLPLTYGSDPGILISITLDKDPFHNISKVVTFLHPSDVYPRGDGDFPFSFIANNASPVFGFRYIGLTYTKISMELLRAPYRTRCFDYQSHGFESAYHCVHSCMTEKLMLLMNRTSFTSTFISHLNEKMLDKYSMYQNKTIASTFTSLYARCKKTCPGKNCFKQIFSPALVSVRNSSDVTFVLYAMNGPEYTLIFKPATTLTDLYVQILSVCGAWLGISCVDIIFNSCAICMGCKHILRKQVTRYRKLLK